MMHDAAFCQSTTAIFYATLRALVLWSMPSGEDDVDNNDSDIDGGMPNEISGHAEDVGARTVARHGLAGRRRARHPTVCTTSLEAAAERKGPLGMPLLL